MRRTIVTGGTRGIGRAVAHALAADGGQVMITGRDQAGVNEAVAALAKDVDDSSRIAGIASDIRDRASVEGLITETAKRFGGVDALVNNAGVGVFADVASMTDADWHQVIDTNLTGVFYASRAVLPELRKSGGGWIINVASLAGRNYFPGGAAYCASKAGLVAFTEALMQEVRFDGIRVSVVMPGSVATEFSGSSPTDADAWKLTSEDVALVVTDLLRHPGRSLPSKIEIRPAQPRPAR